MDPWHALKVHRRWLLGLWLGWLPLMGLLEALQRRGLPAPWAVGLALAYLAGLVGIGLRVRGADCPRCGRPFLALTRLATGALSAWRCRGCAAALGEPLPADDPPAP